MTPEGRVKKLVKKRLEALGDNCWRFMPVQSGFGSVALDFLLCIKGRFVAFETKAPGNKLTPLQQGTKKSIEDAGGLVFVIDDEHSLETAMAMIALEIEYNERPGPKLTPTVVNATFQAQVEGRRAKYLREQFLAKALDAANGGHHGASGAPPKRQAKPRAGGDD